MKKNLAIGIILVLLAGGLGGGAYYWHTHPPETKCKELYWALRDGDVQQVQQLIQSDSRLVNARHDKSTPLANACGIYSPIPNRNQIVEILLKAGADPNVDRGRCLHGAIYSADEECVRLLLDHGADPLIKNAEGKTPLDAAEYYGQQNVVELFKTHGN